MLFFFDFGNYFKMLRAAWREKSRKARFAYLAVLGLSVPLVACFHALCFALDPLFFPGLRGAEVRAPIFMIGHARSGTTLTHRLMSLDQGRFSYFLLWECYFPSLLQKTIIRRVARLDAAHLGGSLAKIADRFEEWRYGKFRHMHAMGLTQPDEDDISLYYSMASAFWSTKMPNMGDVDFYYMNDWPEAKRRRYNDFYRELVKRQLYLNRSEGGELKVHLAKNPAWAGRAASLVEAFPDAKFVVNVRDPRETIPSLLKLVWSSWKELGWDQERQQENLRILTEMSWSSIRHPLDVLAAHPEIKGAVVDYRDLVRDPAATIEELYRELDLSMTAEHRALLAAEGTREKGHKTRHRYDLETFGLDDAIIEEKLGDLFERFGWSSEAC